MYLCYSISAFLNVLMTFLLVGRKKKEEKGKNKRKGTQSDDGEAVPKTGRKKKKKLETDSAIVSVIPCLSIAHPSDVLDMPVDPNEPTYCLCHQVSYGEMIACDKMDVSSISSCNIFNLQIFNFHHSFVFSFPLSYISLPLKRIDVTSLGNLPLRCMTSL